MTRDACGRDWGRSPTFGDKSTAMMRIEFSLAEELNTFYACFEAKYTRPSLMTSAIEKGSSVSHESMITASEDDLWRMKFGGL